MKKFDPRLVTYMTEELAPYSDDLETFWDTLDGETDILDVVGHTLEALLIAEEDEKACRAKAKRFTDLADKHKSMRLGLKKFLHNIMKLTNQKKIPHRNGTVSLRKGAQSVVIHNEKEIPSQLCTVTVTPDKAEIKKQLEAGVQIDGAELVTGPETISIRMK